MKKTLVVLVSALTFCLSVARSESAKTTYHNESQRTWASIDGELQVLFEKEGELREKMKKALDDFHEEYKRGETGSCLHQLAQALRESAANDLRINYLFQLAVRRACKNPVAQNNKELLVKLGGILDKLQEARALLNEAVSSLESFPNKGGNFDQLRLTALRVGIGVRESTEAMLEFKDVARKMTEQ